MAKATKKSKLAASGEELGEQLLESVRQMKAGLRGRVHTAGFVVENVSPFENQEQALARGYVDET